MKDTVDLLDNCKEDTFSGNTCKTVYFPDLSTGMFHSEKELPKEFSSLHKREFTWAIFSWEIPY